MKKILLTLLLTIFFIPYVNAEECNLVATYSSDEYFFRRSSFFNYYLTSIGETSAVVLPLTINTYYTVYFDNADYINLNDYTFNFAGDDYLTFTKSDYYYQFTSNNSYDANIFTKSPLTDWNTLFIYSSEIDTLCLPMSDEETPDEPDVIPDATLDAFYSIYTSKLQLLAQFGSENKFILGSLAVLLSFIVLEIILKLFHGGGYR